MVILGTSKNCPHLDDKKGTLAPWGQGRSVHWTLRLSPARCEPKTKFSHQLVPRARGLSTLHSRIFI